MTNSVGPQTILTTLTNQISSEHIFEIINEIYIQDISTSFGIREAGISSDGGVSGLLLSPGM